MANWSLGRSSARCTLTTTWQENMGNVQIYPIDFGKKFPMQYMPLCIFSSTKFYFTMKEYKLEFSQLVQFVSKTVSVTIVTRFFWLSLCFNVRFLILLTSPGKLASGFNLCREQWQWQLWVTIAARFPHFVQFVPSDNKTSRCAKYDHGKSTKH